MYSAVLVATWTDGLFVFRPDGPPLHELPQHWMRGLTPDGQGGVLAIVNGRSLWRRSPSGSWSEVFAAEVDLACCLAVEDVIYAGTEEATLLRVDGSGRLESLRGFDTVPGRAHWFAGSAIIDGKRVGPPLGVRSMAVTSNGAVLLANVHVGGIPRSLDGGTTWEPTIEIASDVHEVRAHPQRAHVVAAAAAVGLCLSTDGGATWKIEQSGLHAAHCSAVAFAGDDILVSAATDPFTKQGAIYRCRAGEPSPLVPVSGGVPGWLTGNVDTHGITVQGSTIAIADRSGDVYVSEDLGLRWSLRAEGLPAPSSVVIL